MNPILSHAIVAGATAFGTLLGINALARWARKREEESAAGCAECAYEASLPNPYGLYATWPTEDAYAEHEYADDFTAAFTMTNPPQAPSSEEVLFEDIREMYRVNLVLNGEYPTASTLRATLGVSPGKALELKRRFDREFTNEAEEI